MGWNNLAEMPGLDSAMRRAHGAGEGGTGIRTASRTGVRGGAAKATVKDADKTALNADNHSQAFSSLPTCSHPRAWDSTTGLDIDFGLQEFILESLPPTVRFACATWCRAPSRDSAIYLPTYNTQDMTVIHLQNSDKPSSRV